MVNLNLVKDGVVSLDHETAGQEEREAVTYQTSLNRQHSAYVSYVLDP